MTNRIPSLDGLRAISILLVIAGHLCQRSSVKMVGATTFLLAELGVHIFFVISGYLITTLLQNEYERSGRISLSSFYRRRIFRIFPAAYAFILIIAALYPSSRSGLVYALTYTVSYHISTTPWVFLHLWSLSVEEQFYLLWPIALVVGFRHRARIAWIAMLTAAAFRLILALKGSSLMLDYMHKSFPATMDSIAVGCLLAVYAPKFRGRLRWMVESRAIVLAIVATTWTLATLFWDGVLTVFWGIVPMLIALAIFLLVERRDWILNNYVAVTIGVLSYSLYLWQELFTFGSHYSAAVSMPLLFICALGSYLVVERPMIQLGRRSNAKLNAQVSSFNET